MVSKSWIYDLLIKFTRGWHHSVSTWSFCPQDLVGPAGPRRMHQLQGHHDAGNDGQLEKTHGNESIYKQSLHVFYLWWYINIQIMKSDRFHVGFDPPAISNCSKILALYISCKMSLSSCNSKNLPSQTALRHMQHSQFGGESTLQDGARTIHHDLWRDIVHRNGVETVIKIKSFQMGL